MNCSAVKLKKIQLQQKKQYPLIVNPLQSTNFASNNQKKTFFLFPNLFCFFTITFASHPGDAILKEFYIKKPVNKPISKKKVDKKWI